MTFFSDIVRKYFQSASANIFHDVTDDKNTNRVVRLSQAAIAHKTLCSLRRYDDRDGEGIVCEIEAAKERKVQECELQIAYSVCIFGDPRETKSSVKIVCVYM
ncbi:PREDICTED: uncharacterized protein LOC106747054 [Dinoponera quadriceps]|uniref:Uncharacterized protein LOC106747054 n=1 Tax=Dinoponera quadriceps TaxID=609295 RepID=A0A6P3XNF6_DINQU|nr:PREDICTED: uncharacterized protein LOC106747054 [Dinoponera quadriceps]